MERQEQGSALKVQSFKRLVWGHRKQGSGCSLIKAQGPETDASRQQSRALGSETQVPQQSCCYASGQSLQVDPPAREVAVAMGTSLQLTCNLSCEEGVARVQWYGLDTDLGNMQTFPGSSVLSVHGMLSDAGTRMCVGSCGSRSIQYSMQLLVYGEAHPAFLGTIPSPNRSPNFTASPTP